MSIFFHNAQLVSRSASHILIRMLRLSSMLSDFDRVGRLKETISTEGLSRSLLKYADPDGLLPSKVPGLPVFAGLERHGVTQHDPRNSS